MKSRSPPLSHTIPGRKIVDWWDASKRLLMDPQLIQRLKDYDRDNIPQRIIDKVVSSRFRALQLINSERMKLPNALVTLF